MDCDVSWPVDGRTVFAVEDAALRGVVDDQGAGRGALFATVREVAALIDGLRVQIADVEGQLNRRIETQLRELGDQRKYFEAILAEKDRAVEMANAEREKAALVLREEQSRSAEASSRSLQEAIYQGDRQLREHVVDQLAQIEAALVAAEKLSSSRVKLLESEVLAVEERSTLRHAALHEQLSARFEYSERAVAKAEAANEKRFEDANEWRQQSNDRERTQQEQTLRLTATFLPREVADAQFDQLRRNVAELQEKLGRIA